MVSIASTSQTVGQLKIERMTPKLTELVEDYTTRMSRMETEVDLQKEGKKFGLEEEIQKVFYGRCRIVHMVVL